ncbi:immunoglobulin superfamily member 1 [Chrysemys picta bellii]|uniref:immunoglobulin superfamily member 1 n=1 Tax=Chrysemys picta bellii TaxID=8478 RepID=UPI0032B1D9F2
MVSALTVLLLSCWLARRSGVSGQGSYPKPSISVSPGEVIPVGGNITIQCQHQHLGLRFVLYKNKNKNNLTYKDPAGYMAEFPITSARREHGGSYTCHYSNRTIQTAYSEPSDPVQIIVAGQGPSPAPRLPAPHPARPQQMGRPAQALKVGWRGDISAPWRFGDLDPRGDPDPVSAPSLTLHAGDGAQWPCRGLSHAPSPSHCRAQLPQTLHLPEPQHGGVTLGGAVTIRCRGQRRGLEFVLDKAGARNAAAPGGDSAGIKFPIPKASRADGGSNTSYYPHDSDPDQAGEPSYPKPSISLSPSGGVSLGGDVTFWCRGQRRGVRFVLNKEQFHFPPVDTDDNEAVFPIRNVRREHGGSYSCYYHNRSKPFAVSYPSDPVELVVRDPSLPRPSISLSPTGVTAPGADVTIRCQGQRRDVRFFLHKAGDLNPQQHMDPAGDGAEFRIPTVGRQHGGSYNCSYRPRSEPFISSEPSEPVQLVVAGERPGSVSPLPAPHPWGGGSCALTGRSEPELNRCGQA